MLRKMLLPCLYLTGLAFAACNDKPPLPERTLDLKVYPNPTGGALNLVVYMANHNPKFLEVYDPSGKLIIADTLEPDFIGPNLFEKEIHDHPNGYYNVILKSDGAVNRTKVLKQ